MALPPIWPHRLAGTDVRCAAWMVISISFSTDGSEALYRPTTSLLLRSTASVYWMRSLVPRERKSISSTNQSIIITAAGVSTIIPTGMAR